MASDKAYSVEQRVNALWGLAWQAYTPSWTGLTTLGASSAVGRYWQLGKNVSFIAELNAGAGTSLGGGAIAASLPAAAASNSINNTPVQCIFWDGATWWSGTGLIAAGGSTCGFNINGTNHTTVPFPVSLKPPGFWGLLWSSGVGIMVASGTYEAA